MSGAAQPSAQDADPLPSPSASSSSSSDAALDEELTEAEREWQESLQQLELLLTMVLIPFVGKYYGRKFAYWGWGKFMEWKHPVEMIFTDKRAFKATGVVEAAASL